MKAKIDCILDFLKDVAAHNDRGWFAEHKGQYEEARGLFEEMCRRLSIVSRHLTVVWPTLR